MGTHGQDSCNCLLNLNHIIEKVTHNYSGFADKINAYTEKQYNLLVDSLRNLANNSHSLTDCYKLLNTYRLYFLDKHLQLTADLPPGNTPVFTDTSVHPLQTNVTREQIVTYLTANKAHLKPLEGIWNTVGYETGIMYNERANAYRAIICRASNKSWKPGMIKFISKPIGNAYTTIYGRGDFGSDTITTNLYKNFMEMEGYGTWQKTFPSVKDSFTVAQYNVLYGGEVQMRMLNDTTLYIGLKSCDPAHKQVLDSLMKANADKLKTIPFWIVDFRGNQGGSTDVYQSLLPYFYTKTLYVTGDKHWMTPGNTAQMQQFVNENKTVMDRGTVAIFNTMISYGLAHPGAWFDGGCDSLKYPEVLPYPKHIAVLSDKNNASSGETFLMVVHDLSDKVTIFGENSAGYLDYGDVFAYTLPCSKLMMYIPTRRSNYLDDGQRYSYTGFPPDVRIPANTKDWIDFIFKYRMK
jgi:hypothetical protein